MPYKAKVSLPIIVVAIVIVAILFYSNILYVTPQLPIQPPSTMGEPSITGSLTIDDTLSVAQDYLEFLGKPDLAVAEIMEFSNHFYVDVYEENTGVHAFELIIERDGDVYPEHGPNMMWNTKYGHHGSGMMGSRGMMGIYSESAEMPIGEDGSIDYAQRYLDKFMPGATAVEPHRFYGYYTLHVDRDGNIIGMLSVNGYNGDVWYHSWHGEFIQIMELQEHHED